MLIHGHGFTTDEQMSGEIVLALDENNWAIIQLERELLERAAQFLKGQGLEVILKSPREIEVPVYNASEIAELGDLDDLEDIPLEELLEKMKHIEAQEALVTVVLEAGQASLEGHTLEPSYSGHRELRPLWAILP
jgi:glutamyl-tRNA reductase